MPNTIHFYNYNEPYYEFTNFFMRKITLKGKEWPSTEHYFQAQKFVGTPAEEKVRLLKKPREAYDFAHIRTDEVRQDWKKVRDDIMREAVRAKFTQHADLAQILLETGDALLVEHTGNDDYWGDGGDGRGKNKLGKILMEIRSELRKKTSRN